MKKLKCKITKVPERKLKKAAYGGYNFFKQESYNNYDESKRQTQSSFPLAFRGLDQYGKSASSNLSTEGEEIGNIYPEVDEELANIEAEKDELIWKSNGELYKINGKKHSKEGTPIIAEEGDFIFSDFIKIKGEDLKPIYPKIKEKDKRYKTGVSPAMMASKLLSMNRNVANLQSDDPFERDTAQLNIDAFNVSLAEIAFIQEQTKDFEGGFPERLAQYIPDLAQQATPSQREEDEQSQTFQKGGTFKPTYSEKEAYGTKGLERLLKMQENLKSLGYDAPMVTRDGKQVPDISAMQQYLVSNHPELVRDYMSRVDPTNAATEGNAFKGFQDNLWWYRFPEIEQEKFTSIDEYNDFIDNNKIVGASPEDGEIYSIGTDQFYIPKLSLPETQEPPVVEKKLEEKLRLDPKGKGDGTTFVSKVDGFQPDDIGIAGALAQSILPPNLVDPVLQQVSPRYQEANLVSPQEAINAITNQSTRLGSQLVASMTPQLAASNLANIAGRTAEGISSTRQRYDNANAQILNQVDAANTGTFNRANAINTQLKGVYDRERATLAEAKYNTNLKRIQTATNALGAGDYNDYLANAFGTSGILQNFMLSPTGEIMNIPGIGADLTKGSSSGLPTPQDWEQMPEGQKDFYKTFYGKSQNYNP